MGRGAWSAASLARRTRSEGRSRLLGRGSRTALMILTKVLVALKFKRFGYTNAPAEPRSFVCHVGMGPWGRCFSKNLETCDTLDPRLGTAHRSSVGLGFINVSSFVKSLGSSGKPRPTNYFPRFRPYQPRKRGSAPRLLACHQRAIRRKTAGIRPRPTITIDPLG